MTLLSLSQTILDPTGVFSWVTMPLLDPLQLMLSCNLDKLKTNEKQIKESIKSKISFGVEMKDLQDSKNLRRGKIRDR